MPVNIELLAHKSLHSLADVAKQNKQEIRLSLDPGKRIWLLDKAKVKQALYYLIVSIIEASEPGGEIRVHISHRNQTLQIALWTYHPWIGDGLPHVHLQPPFPRSQENASSVQQSLELASENPQTDEKSRIDHEGQDQALTVASLEAIIHELTYSSEQAQDNTYNFLGLLLWCYLAESHDGKVLLQGTPDTGYRYVLILPEIPINGV